MNIRCLFATLLIFLAGCTCHVPVPDTIKPAQIQGYINLNHHPLKLHFWKPNTLRNDNVLIVYATGDGGWRGLSKQLFEWVSIWDYPAVGFSSSDYLKSLKQTNGTTTPRRLARDFKAIIQFAEKKLDMPPSTRIILAGLSRGAGLAVVAAGQDELRSNLGGVIAIALTKEEEHVVHYRHRRGSQSNQPARELAQIQTYEYLPRIASVPVVVIQSTHDGYLTAGAARALFGPDTELKKLRPIEAKNHRFTGGCPHLHKEAEAALAWIYSIAQPLGSFP